MRQQALQHFHLFDLWDLWVEMCPKECKSFWVGWKLSRELMERHPIKTEEHGYFVLLPPPAPFLSSNWSALQQGMLEAQYRSSWQHWRLGYSKGRRRKCFYTRQQIVQMCAHLSVGTWVAGEWSWDTGCLPGFSSSWIYCNTTLDGDCRNWWHI